MKAKRLWMGVVAGTLCVLLDTSLVEARSLSSVFSTELKGLEMEPLGPALANTVASTYPVASASSSVTYVVIPATETFERQTRCHCGSHVSLIMSCLLPRCMEGVNWRGTVVRAE